MTTKASEYRVSRKSCGFQNCMSGILDIRHFSKLMAILAILDPLYGILKIRFEIRNQWLRKPPSTELCENRRVSKILCPPYWIRHFDKWKSDVKFVISNPKSPAVQSSTKIVGFPKYYVRHIGSAILNSENPMSDS